MEESLLSGLLIVLKQLRSPKINNVKRTKSRDTHVRVEIYGEKRVKSETSGAAALIARSSLLHVP